MKTLAQNVCYACRTFVKNPAFTLAAVLSMAIGIGANTAIFSVANALLLHVRTMSERVDEALARRRFSMLFLGLFAGLSLALAAIGIYGVVAYLLSQGTREIGIRMALGATQPAILVLAVRQGMILALAGVVMGLGLALAVTRFMQSLLFGINATDGFTFAAISMLLALVTLLASYIPARRAARIEPRSLCGANEYVGELH